MFVIIVGNVIDGVFLVGPFSDGNVANEYAGEEFPDDEWVVAMLQPPKPWE